MIARRLFAVVLLFVPVTALAADPAKPAFADRAKESFAKWDADKNGTLTREEIDRAVSDPEVKGADAAAIVALKRAVRSTKYKLPPLTKDAVLELASNPGKDRPDLNAMYASAFTRITSANHDLFPKGVPSLDTLHQGKLGDCFCLAPLGSMVCRDPKDVVKMIRKQPDGSYLVRLGTRDVPVPAPTDAEIALTATGGPDGVWVNVYEKAVGLTRVAKAKADGTTDPSLIDLLSKGGSAGTTIGLVTGNPIERFSCSFAKGDKASEKEVAAKLDDLRKKLVSAFADKRLVTCGTASGVTTPGVNGNHAYAVVGYDPKADEILLWNPHGQAFTPKGKPGLENGYPTKNGQFRMPLPEFVRTFAGVAFEVPPAK
ncbi:MAG: peptidase C2 [Planctomycetes bacterium]|nr:peptidase C2 [Planctomycetota bacterium]